MLFRIFILVCLACPTALLAQTVQIEKLTDLHRLEASRGLLVNSGKVFVGKTILNKFDSSLEVYATDSLKRVDMIEMPHSVGAIYADGENKVIVIGKTANPWLTFATYVRFEKDQLKITKTTHIPEEHQVDKMAVVNGKLYFNERGTRSIVTKGLFGYKKLKFEISGPDDMVGLGDELWMIEGRGVGHGDESLSVYNTKTEDYAQVKLMNIGPRGINSLIAVPDFELLAIDDAVGGRVLLIDPLMRKVQDEITIGEDIRSLALYGSCIAALRTTAKEIVWLKIDDSRKLSEIERWDIDSGDEASRNPLDISVDELSGKTFVRSTEPCLFCPPTTTYASVFRVESESDTITNHCKN